MTDDHYVVTSRTVKEPPQTLWTRLKFLGPGFILSASIVGSGELIATTLLGGKAGFILFWVIILSCFVKVAIQLEFGKRAILTGETPMKSFSRLTTIGQKKNTWPVWIVFILTLLKVLQMGGMLGGSAIVMSMLFPFLHEYVFVVLLALFVSLLIYKNYYRLVEKASLLMVVAFTLLTIVSLFAINYTEFRITWDEFVSGLQLRLPSELVIFAIGTFGITGVASDEIIAYNYWCIEKGYAAYSGPFEDTPEWKKRARGWMKVMYLDAGVAMAIYTSVTAAFYLLGASILHGRSETPQGNELISVLANIYTESLGDGIRIAYIVGAFFVLFSSVFATLAYWSRLFSDIFGQLGWMDFSNPLIRKKAIAILAWSFPVIWAIAYLFIELPVIMILSGGIVGSLLLLLVVFAAICFRYRLNNRAIKSSLTYDILLWASVISILTVAAYGIIQLA